MFTFALRCKPKNQGSGRVGCRKFGVLLPKNPRLLRFDYRFGFFGKPRRVLLPPAGFELPKNRRYVIPNVRERRLLSPMLDAPFKHLPNQVFLHSNWPN